MTTETIQVTPTPVDEPATKLPPRPRFIGVVACRSKCLDRGFWYRTDLYATAKEAYAAATAEDANPPIPGTARVYELVDPSEVTND